MVALVVAGGDLSNLDAIEEERMPRRADQRLDEYIAEAREMFGS